MSVLDIRKAGDPVLKKSARPVQKINKQIRILIDNMIETMNEADGVGLAAPQVGVSLRVVVIDVGGGVIELVNPEIIKASEEIETGVEACLSIPGLVGEVDRAYQIMVKAQNRRGQNVKIKARGWLARIFQHEIDHLDGVLFTDRAEKVWKPSAEEQAAIRD